MFNRRAMVFAILALILGITGAYTNFKWIEGQKPDAVTQVVEVPAAATYVVIAKADLGAGGQVRDLELTSVQWPSELLPAGSFNDTQAVVGRVPRRVIATGEPILEQALLPLGTAAGLSPIIADGHRAVAVKVDEVIGIAGFVKPGARVDVLATIRNRAGSSRESFSNVILQDTKVLAIDQNLEESGSAGEPSLVSVVTLEVLPQEAEKLTFAAHEGKLQLALRNPADSVFVKTASIDATSLRGLAPAKKKKVYQPTRVEVIKGLEVSKRSF